MGTHLFSSVTPTGTQNMVKDWDAKITLGNMENQLGKYNERQMAPLICFILLSYCKFRHTGCWRLNYITERFFISYFKGIGFCCGQSDAGGTLLEYVSNPTALINIPFMYPTALICSPHINIQVMYLYYNIAHSGGPTPHSVRNLTEIKCWHRQIESTFLLEKLQTNMHDMIVFGKNGEEKYFSGSMCPGLIGCSRCNQRY